MILTRDRHGLMLVPQAAAVTRVEQAVIFTIRAIVVGELTDMTIAVNADGRDGRAGMTETPITVGVRVSTPGDKAQVGGQPSRYSMWRGRVITTTTVRRPPCTWATRPCR